MIIALHPRNAVAATYALLDRHSVKGRCGNATQTGGPPGLAPVRK